MAEARREKRLRPSEQAPQLVRSTAVLEQHCEALVQADLVGFDCEFVRRRTYWAQSCLIQLAFNDSILLIDSLNADVALTPLWHAIQHSKAIWSAHAPRQDLEIFWRSGNVLPARVFDTQLASALCGFRFGVSYEELVESVCGVTLDKSARNTDWSRRPFTASQLRYAEQDARHLIPLTRTLLEHLQSSGRHDWWQDDMTWVSRLPELLDNTDDSWLRLRTRGRNATYLCMLRAVGNLRERLARHWDQPRGWIMSDDQAQQLASQCVKDLQDFVRDRSSAGGQRVERILSGRWYKTEESRTHLVQAIQTALGEANDPKIVARIQEQLSESRRAPTREPSALEILKLAIKVEAERLNIAHELIATSAQLNDIIQHNDPARVLSGWRLTAFGPLIHSVLNGGITLHLHRNGAQILAQTAIPSAPKL